MPSSIDALILHWRPMGYIRPTEMLFSMAAELLVLVVMASSTLVLATVFSLLQVELELEDTSRVT